MTVRNGAIPDKKPLFCTGFVKWKCRKRCNLLQFWFPFLIAGLRVSASSSSPGQWPFGVQQCNNLWKHWEFVRFRECNTAATGVTFRAEAERREQRPEGRGRRAENRENGKANV